MSLVWDEESVGFGVVLFICLFIAQGALLQNCRLNFIYMMYFDRLYLPVEFICNKQLRSKLCSESNRRIKKLSSDSFFTSNTVDHFVFPKQLQHLFYRSNFTSLSFTSWIMAYGNIISLLHSLLGSVLLKIRFKGV